MSNELHLESGQVKHNQSDDSTETLIEAYLHSPKGLSQALLDIAGRYVSTRNTDDDTYETFVVQTEIDDPRFSYVNVSYPMFGTSSHTIQSVQETENGYDTAPVLRISRGPQCEVTDGAGNLLEGDDLVQVRRIIDAIARAYEEDVIRTTQQFDVETSIKTSLEVRVAELETELNHLRMLQKENESGTVRGYRVVLKSGWEREGESSTDAVYMVASIEEAVRRAVEEFKELNGRSDVQADVSVFAIGEGGASVSIPRETYVPLFKSVSTHSYEQSDIKHIRSGYYTFSS